MASQFEATQATQPARDASLDGPGGGEDSGVPATSSYWGRLVRFGTGATVDLERNGEDYTLGRHKSNAVVIEHLQVRVSRRLHLYTRPI